MYITTPQPPSKVTSCPGKTLSKPKLNTSSFSAVRSRLVSYLYLLPGWAGEVSTLHLNTAEATLVTTAASHSGQMPAVLTFCTLHCTPPNYICNTASLTGTIFIFHCQISTFFTFNVSINILSDIFYCHGTVIIIAKMSLGFITAHQMNPQSKHKQFNTDHS